MTFYFLIILTDIKLLKYKNILSVEKNMRKILRREANKEQVQRRKMNDDCGFIYIFEDQR